MPPETNGRLSPGDLGLTEEEASAIEKRFQKRIGPPSPSGGLIPSPLKRKASVYDLTVEKDFEEYAEDVEKKYKMKHRDHANVAHDPENVSCEPYWG